MNPEWKNRYEAGVEATEQAGQLALRYFDTDLAVEWKKDESPVTVADREAEMLLRTTLLAKFPQDGFLGEEHGNKQGTSGFRWIVDPIDGTRSFVRGIPIWATLVGLEYKGETVAGIASIPALRQQYRALRGEGAYRDERRIRVSDATDLAKASLFYSSINWFIQAGKNDVFMNMATMTFRPKSMGDFWGFLLVAQGSGEIMLEHGVHIWDVAALKPIVEEAGGRFTDWDGVPTIERTDVIASNGKLHEEALRLLRAN